MRLKTEYLIPSIEHNCHSYLHAKGHKEMWKTEEEQSKQKRNKVYRSRIKMILIRNSGATKICFYTDENTWYKIESSYDFLEIGVYDNNY